MSTVIQNQFISYGIWSSSEAGVHQMMQVEIRNHILCTVNRYVMQPNLTHYFLLMIITHCHTNSFFFQNYQAELL